MTHKKSPFEAQSEDSDQLTVTEGTKERLQPEDSVQNTLALEIGGHTYIIVRKSEKEPFEITQMEGTDSEQGGGARKVRFTVMVEEIKRGRRKKIRTALRVEYPAVPEEKPIVGAQTRYYVPRLKPTINIVIGDIDDATVVPNKSQKQKPTEPAEQQSASEEEAGGVIPGLFDEMTDGQE